MDRELEKTLESLQQEFGKFVKVLSSTNKQVIKNTKSDKEEEKAKKRLKRTMYDYLKEVNEGKSKTYEFTEAVEDAQEELKGFKRVLKAMPSPMGLVRGAFNLLKKAVVGTTMAVLETAVAFGKTNSNIKTLGEATEHGAEHLGKFGKFINAIAGEVDDNIQMFKGLAQSGATFNSSIEEMRNEAFKAGMPLVQFQELIEDNTVTLGKMFGSVNQGVREFAELGRGLRKFTKEELAGFGITMTEANQFLGTFTELQRARGMSERMNAQSLLAGTQKYIKQLTTLSRLTGQSVTELDAQMKQDALDGVLQAKLAQMSEEDAAGFQAVLRQFPAEARGAIMELGLLEAPISDAAVGLSFMSNGAIPDMIKSAMRAGKMTDEQAVDLANKIRAAGNNILQSGDAAATAAMAGGDGIFKAGLDIAAAMAGGKVDQAEFDKATLEAQKGVTKELVNTQSTMEENTVALQSLGTTMMAQLLLDDKSKGAQVLRSFNKDAGQTTQAMVDAMERIFGLTDTSKVGIKSEYDPMDENDGTGPQAYNGTPGFQDFGAGTKVTLHKSEMVLPEKNVGELAKKLAQAVGTMATTNTTNTTNNAADNNVVNNTTQMDMSTLNANTEKLIASNERVANHLNTLVTIGAMTEKNTKNTNNNLANMSGSLV